MMNRTNPTPRASQPLAALTLLLCLGALPLVGGLTGCTTGSRYKQSTGEYIDDRGLSFHVKKALGNDTLYKYEDVKVDTFKGVVQLNGFVNTKAQKSRAGVIAQNVKGVDDVQNKITVKE